MLGVVHALVRERVVVPNGQVRDRDEHGVEHEGNGGVAEELGHLGAQHLRHDDVGGARGGTPRQVEGGRDGEERSGHHDQKDVLDHVVPEELPVVDADEAEDGNPGRDQCAEEGHRLADGPPVTGMQGVVAPHPPQVEERGRLAIIATGTKSNWVEVNSEPRRGRSGAS